MYFGGIHRPRRRNWATWIAFRSTATSIGALVAAYILKSTALATLTREQAGMGLDGSGWAAVTLLQENLLLVPLPGLALGVAAIMMKPLRPLLATLAAIASMLAVLLIVGVLVLSLAPMYRVPQNLGRP